MSEGAVLISLARLVAAPGRRDALRAALLALIEPTRSEPGTLDYVLFEVAETPGTFIMREAFTSEAALRAHQETPHYREFASFADDLLAEPLELTFLTRVSD
ncbi:putative quinol monooxygenase [Microbacterium hydrocarbonoxydans]|uniref:putative quinol monooxygenase n=1 Tax=Microbacterium hydrocarbonoxydans TaxID=273678 RepID=UPI0020413943|nr:putative quinol monooxygenase [Microbacterium hydrocarbonoxydans]MCM3780713.1 antibiotic biosynthesis monooxygenase [Microbacterium hydrocarbonoxydans]